MLGPGAVLSAEVVGEKWSDSGPMLKVEPAGFPDGLHGECERERPRISPSPLGPIVLWNIALW